MEEDFRVHMRTPNTGVSGTSGWITTDVAARAVRVSPQTIRRFIERGELAARQEGEGVEKRWLVSVDSLHVLRATRTDSVDKPRVPWTAGRENDADENESKSADSIADVLRELAARLEDRAAEAAKLRTRLELTNKAQSTIEAERDRLATDLERERERADEAERRLEELEVRTAAPVDSSREVPSEALDGSEKSVDLSLEEEDPETNGGPQTVARRSWWRRLFGS